MKQIQLLLGGLLGCVSAMAQQSSLKTFTVTVTNQWTQAKTNEPVVIDLKKTLVDFPVRSATVMDGRTEVASQLDDLNADYVPDELVFVTNVPPKSTKTFKVTLYDRQERKQYDPKVYAHLRLNDKSKKYPFIQSVTALGSNPAKWTYGSIYGHGICFESELTAFRLYFDNRQSVDLYGKKHYRLELAQTNFYTNKDFKRDGYGNDVLWAGQSVGLGSFRGVDNDFPQYVDSVQLRGMSILAAGPVRVVAEIKDKGWYYKGKQVDMVQHYTLYAGHRDVEASIRLSAPDIRKELFCTGVQKLERDNVGFLNRDGLAGSWGTNLPEKGDTVLIPRATVGLGIYVPKTYVNHVKEDEHNYLYILRPDEGGKINYHFTFCCTMEEKGMKDRKTWFNYLKNWQAALQHPCKVDIK